LPADLRETLEITECASVLFLADDLETSDFATDVLADLALLTEDMDERPSNSLPTVELQRRPDK